MSKWTSCFSTTNNSQFVNVNSTFWRRQGSNMWKRNTHLNKRTTGDMSAQKIAQQAKWRMQSSLPKEILGTLGKANGICREVALRVAGIKLSLVLRARLSPDRYREGISLFREAVGRRHKLRRKKQIVLSLLMQDLPAQDKRAAQKQSTARSDASHGCPLTGKCGGTSGLTAREFCSNLTACHGNGAF